MERFFKLREHGTDVRTEVVAGTATFMTMAYIIFVNPTVLGAAGIPFAAAIVATCLAAGVMTLAMGIFTNYPFAMAAGMGLNAFLAFSLVIGMGLSPQTAMGVVVVEGIIITLLVLTKIREQVMDAIPLTLKKGIGVGIGLFIAFVGLYNGGIVVKHPAPDVPMAVGELTSPNVVLTLVGLLITIVLMAYRVKGALLLGILGTTLLAVVGERGWGVPLLIEGALDRAAQVVSLPTAESFATIGQVDVVGVIFGGAAVWGVVFAFMMTDFFDTMGTVVSVGGQGKFLDARGRLPRLGRVLLIDSLGAIVGGLFGISSNTTYVESAAGVGEGGRTGLTAVVTSLFFFAAIFFTPVIGLVPREATAPALILVGFLMLSVVTDIDFGNLEEALPAFLILLTIPLSFSISHGIGYGFISYTLIKLFRGKFRELNWLIVLVSLLFVVDLFKLIG